MVHVSTSVGGIKVIAIMFRPLGKTLLAIIIIEVSC